MMLKLFNLFNFNYYIIDLGYLSKVLVILFSSLILIECIDRYIFYSGGARKIINDIGTGIILGGAAKIGADGVDYFKDKIRSMKDGGNSGSTESSDDTEGKGSSDDNNKKT
uniref:Uncharacterized protein n=1 Tax=Trametes versicolor TaxID=5325 RepID=A0A7S8WV41_TRAVE|nr:hypothetical protein J6772_mgp22 [Trametes versicolor]QPF23618.1 hypothetical protein [Trametes versicolor]